MYDSQFGSARYNALKKVSFLRSHLTGLVGNSASIILAFHLLHIYSPCLHVLSALMTVAFEPCPLQRSWKRQAQDFTCLQHLGLIPSVILWFSQSCCGVRPSPSWLHSWHWLGLGEVPLFSNHIHFCGFRLLERSQNVNNVLRVTNMEASNRVCWLLKWSLKERREMGEEGDLVF